MKKLNDRGFTMVEMLAVVVILGVLAAITIPTVSTIIRKNKEDNIKNLNNTIISAAKMYMSDNRYKVELEYSKCGGVDVVGNEIKDRKIIKINNVGITNSQLPIKVLVSNGYIKGKMTDPDTKKEMDADSSYIVVIYDCYTKDYKYEEPKIFWK